MTKYRFSFTAASLSVEEMVQLSKVMTEQGLSLEQLKPQNLKKNRAVTSKRIFNELSIRLKSLTLEEIEVLSNSNSEEQKLICLIAFGRTYKYFRDFIEEVILEKITLFDLQLSELDYNIFFNRKLIDHEELDNLTTKTQYKIKQVLFTVLEQAGLIDSVKTKNIQVPYINSTFENLIASTNPNDLKLLLYTENRILNR